MLSRKCIISPLSSFDVDLTCPGITVLPTVISYDKENDPEALALIASSAALAISGIPFMGPVAAAKVGMIDGEFVLNPTKEQIKDSQLELIVAVRKMLY